MTNETPDALKNILSWFRPAQLPGRSRSGRPTYGPVWPTTNTPKRLSTKGKVRERDPHRIRRKNRRKMAKASRRVNRAG